MMLILHGVVVGAVAWFVTACLLMIYESKRGSAQFPTDKEKKTIGRALNRISLTVGILAAIYDLHRLGLLK